MIKETGLYFFITHVPLNLPPELGERTIIYSSFDSSVERFNDMREAIEQANPDCVFVPARDPDSSDQTLESISCLDIMIGTKTFSKLVLWKIDRRGMAVH